MDDNKDLQISPNVDQSQIDSTKQTDDKSKVDDKSSPIPYGRFKDVIDEKNTLKEELEKAIAETKKYEGMDIEELQELKKLQQDLKTNPELLPYIKQKVSEWYAGKKTPTETTIKPNAKIVDLERRMEKFEIDKLSARIEDNLGKLERDFGKFDKKKLLTLVEEDGYNPTSYKHVKACFKEYFSDDISAKKKSDLEQKIKNLPEGGGSGGKPADATPDDIGDLFRLKKAGKI